MVVAKKYILAKKFEGVPNDENIELKEEELPALQDGEVLFEAIFLSVDPYVRIFPIPVGSVLLGAQVAKVTESKNKDYEIGELCVAGFGWRSHTVADPSKHPELQVFKLPALGDLLSPSLALGSLGMPGGTAHQALLNIGEPKEGETVVVSGAAGAVGHIVGQIAKIKKCTVIGFAGSDEKVSWLKEIGFDHAYNYKTCDLSDSLKESAPAGVDVYFDNVGGHTAGTIVNNHMAVNGRVICVGNISTYNTARGTIDGPYPFSSVLGNRLTMKGYLYFDENPDGIRKAQLQLIKWSQEGKLVTREHVVEGFSRMREVFYGLFKGDNIGKAIIKV